MAKAKPNSKFNLDKLNTALDALDKLGTKPKEELTLRESIYFMRGKLNAALRKGYSYEDLSEILAEQDILVSAATLKLYLNESSKGKGRSKKKSSAGRGKKVKAADNSSSELSSVSLTKVNDSKEELADSNSTAEINRMKKEKESEVTP